MSAKKQEKKKLSFPLRLLIVVIILVTIFLCSAILGNEYAAPDNENGSDLSASTSDTSSTDSSVLIDDDKLKVSFVGTQDASSLGVFYVTLKIKNKTDSVMMINLENASVDNETIPMITTGVPLVIQPGNSGQTGFIFSMVNLSISSMEEAESATFQVVARDNDSMATIYTSEFVTVELN